MPLIKKLTLHFLYRSAEFFQKLGINVVVCKPNKVPLAKLIAAQTNIKLVSNNAGEFFAANPASFFTSEYPGAAWIDLF
jgi:K+-transporting ATPase A subunit